MEKSLTAPAMHFSSPLEPTEEDVNHKLSLLKRFRVATSTIVAANRFKLVLEAEAEKPEQAVREILALLSHATLDEKASTEESLVLLRLEGMHAADPEAECEMIILPPSAADNVSVSSPNQGHPTPEGEESSQYEQGGIARCEQVFKEAEEWPLASLDELFKEAEEDPIASLDDLFEDLLHSATGSIWKGDYEIQGGTNDHISLQHETTMSDYPLPDSFPMPDFPVSEEEDMLCDQDYGIRSGQYDQERRRRSDLGSQLKLLQKDQERGQWKELVSNMSKEIAETFGEIDQAPYRLKVQHMKSNAEDTSNRLKSTIQKFEEKFKLFLKELRRLLNNLCNSVSLPTVANAGQQQQIIETISRVVESFSCSALRNIVRDMSRISGKLDRLVKDLGARELSKNTLFQNCASSIFLKVESFLGRQGSNFISVADFSDWYHNEVYYNPSDSGKSTEESSFI